MRGRPVSPLDSANVGFAVRTMRPWINIADNTLTERPVKADAKQLPPPSL
jgi:hypothetical protein